jgi:hypothetical protein
MLSIFRIDPFKKQRLELQAPCIWAASRELRGSRDPRVARELCPGKHRACSLEPNSDENLKSERRVPERASPMF